MRAPTARVSTPSFRLYSAPQLEHLHRDRLSGLAYMLIDDFDKLRYAYDLHLNYDGLAHADGEERLNQLLLEFDQYTSGHARAETLIHALIQRVILEHLEYERSVFELHQPASAASPQLSIVPAWSIRRRWRNLQQATPTDTTMQWRSLTAASLMSFDLPGSTSRDLYKTMQIITTLERHRPTSTTNLIKDSRYNFAAHTRLANEVTARGCAAIGWDGRGQFVERSTNSHRVYRELRFIQVWTGILRAVIERLNNITSNKSLMGASPFRVSMVGLPNADLVDELLVAVTTGSQSLDAIRDQVIFPPKTNP